MYAGSSSGATEWNDTKIQYRLTGENPTINFDKSPKQCLIKMNIDGVKQTVLLDEESLQINGEKKLDSEGRCLNLAVVATGHSLIVNVVIKKSWKNSNSQSSSNSTSSNLHSSSSKKSTNSTSSGVSEHTTSLGFASWNDKKIEFYLKGGDSITSDIQEDPKQCLIEFDIDRGKHKRRIILKSGSLIIDGKEKKIDDQCSKLLVTATRKPLSLSIQVDGEEVWNK